MGGGVGVVYIDGRFRGARPACPTPVTGRSASFRLRFRFVPCMRARRSCAGACRPLSLSLRLPGARIDVVVSGPLFAHLLGTGAWVLIVFGTSVNLLPLFLLLCAWVLTSE